MFYEFNKQVEEKIKCEACQAFYRFFRYEFNKFSNCNTGAQMFMLYLSGDIKITFTSNFGLGAQWLIGRVLDWRPKGCGFEPHRSHCVVSLSKNINLSLVLVQLRKTRPYITERLLMERKESNKQFWPENIKIVPIYT